MSNSYYIESLELQAQGVAKPSEEHGKTITFIPKTLPGEVVRADVYQERKNTHRAKLIEVIEASDKRVAAGCPHYDSCPSCHYLHTSYQNELEFKKQALARQLQFLYSKKSYKTPSIDIIQSPNRSHYRNRVQLHYRHKYLGFIDSSKDQVLETPECQLIRPELQEAFDSLYRDKSWTREHSGSGHVELYWQDGEVKTHWNKDYAAGGFSQVNQAINNAMGDSILNILEKSNTQFLLDLFSGKGNLSNCYQQKSQCQRLMADISPYNHPDYLQLNLFDDDAFERFTRRFGKPEVDCLLIDPPRAGFKQLEFWLKKLKPKKLIYISCNPQSLANDLRSLVQNGSKFTVETIQLFDMFPGTYHFETLIDINFKRHAK